MPSQLVEKMLSLLFTFCTFIITAQGNNVEEIFHNDLVWVPFEADAKTEVYPIALHAETCTITYKMKKICPPPNQPIESSDLTPRCEGDFDDPALKTWVVAECTEDPHCKKVKAQVKIPSTDRTQSQTFTYVIGCIPIVAGDAGILFGDGLPILIVLIVLCIGFFMGRFIWSRHSELCISYSSRLFPWRAGVYNVNTLAGHSMTALSSEVTSTTQQEDYATSHSMTALSSEVTSTTQQEDYATSHPMTALSSEVISTTKQEDYATSHPMTALSSEVTSTTQQEDYATSHPMTALPSEVTGTTQQEDYATSHSMTAQPSEVTSTTQQEDYATSHSMTALSSELTSTTQQEDYATRSPDVDNVGTIAEHSNTAQPPEVTSEAQQVEEDVREGVNNRTTVLEQGNSADTSKDEGTSQRLEDDSRAVEANSQKNGTPPKTEATMKFVSKSDEVISEA